MSSKRVGKSELPMEDTSRKSSNPHEIRDKLLRGLGIDPAIFGEGEIQREDESKGVITLRAVPAKKSQQGSSK